MRGLPAANHNPVRLGPCSSGAFYVSLEQRRMERMKRSAYLDGQLLIAMPGIGDPRFARSLIYLCAHSENGAMGIIVNKRAPMISFIDLLDKLEVIPEG